ncbi:hypothetical protein [Methylomonas sp. MK1]|uniref:hypothetical protein n=1 Tax=Methylomonas sp. MK1 TaxID=1131552 RepID=UPI00036D7791|nr:hypothetical protein [Methylomonas sp. MK1]
MNLIFSTLTAIRRNARWLLRLAVLKRLFGIALTLQVFIGFVNIALAKPIEGLCLSEVGQRPVVQRSDDEYDELSVTSSPLMVEYKENGKTYYLVAGKHHVALQDDQHKVLQIESAHQDQGRITELKVGKGYFVVEGGTDYLGSLSPPYIRTHKFVNLEFIAGGKPYRFLTKGFPEYGIYGFLGLFDGEGKRVTTIPPIHSADPWYGSDYYDVYDLALTKDGWLWVNGTDTDYLVPVDTRTAPPTIGEPLELSKLLGNECWPGTNWLLACFGSNGYYSRVLDRVFVYSTRRSFFGLLPATAVEIVNGQPIPLPPELAKVIAKQAEKSVVRPPYPWGHLEVNFKEVPSLNGVLFKGPDGEALFYDGKKVTSLFDKIKNEKVLAWHNIAKAENGNLIFGITTEKKRLIAELMPDLNVSITSMSYDSKNFFPYQVGKIFKTPDLKLWMESYVISIEDNKTLLPIIVSSTPTFLGNETYVANSKEEFFVFEAKNPTTGKHKDYFIVRDTPGAHCIAKLDPDKPIELSMDNQ